MALLLELDGPVKRPAMKAPTAMRISEPTAAGLFMISAPQPRTTRDSAARAYSPQRIFSGKYISKQQGNEGSISITTGVLSGEAGGRRREGSRISCTSGRRH